MSQVTSPPGSNNSAPAHDKRPKAPPEERFWQRYSPHHEFPLSGVGSVVLHVLLVLTMVWIFFQFMPASESEPLSLGAIQVDAGGGGNLEGLDQGRGDGLIPTGKVEAAQEKHQENTSMPDQVVKNTPLAKASPARPNIDMPAEADRVMPDEGGPPIEKFLAIKNAAEKTKIAGKIAGRGKGGPGSGGGRGTGTGTGTGSGIGEGTQRNISVRQKRMERWIMIFETRNGPDYLDQLRSLKAILAVPLEGKPKEGFYRVFRDLSKTPVQGKAEDVRPLNRIFWVDEQRMSVSKLSEALGIREPPFIAAFFPKELEDNLREQERQHSGNCPEDDIEHTYFRVVPSGAGYTAQFERIETRR